ncbi:MAG: hypothetical protein ABI327_12175 [Burkholderiaceae bacterium]
MEFSINEQNLFRHSIRIDAATAEVPWPGAARRAGHLSMYNGMPQSALRAEAHLKR